MISKQLTAVQEVLSQLCASGVETVSGSDALMLLAQVAQLKSVVGSLEMSLMRRLDQTNQHQARGFRSPAELIACETGQSTTEASKALVTARHLESLPETASRLSSGELSLSQVSEIARGASIDPSAEGSLLDQAKSDSLEALRRKRLPLETRRVPSLETRRQAQRFCYRPGQVGMTEFFGTVANEDFAFLKSELDARASVAFRRSRNSGLRRPQSSYLAEGLIELAKNAGSGSEKPRSSRPTINVIVDHSVLVGEGSGSCEIPGVGPIAAETARSWANDCYLNVLLTKGRDVLSIGSTSRYIPAELRKSFVLRDQICSVRNCETSVGLELDHREELQDGGLSTFDNLGLLCRHHHLLKTHKGFSLQGSPGDYILVPPTPPPQSDNDPDNRLFPPGAA